VQGNKPVLTAQYYTPRRKKGKLIPYILASLLLHVILLLLLYLILNPDNTNKLLSKKPNFIEITDVPVPKKKETKPPKEAKRFAERSHKAEKEKTRDDFTKRGSIGALPRPKPATQPRKKQIQRKREAKKPQRRKKEQVASLPKGLREPRPEKEFKERRKPTLEELLSPRSLPPSIPRPQSRDFLGSRNVPNKEDTVDLNTTEFRYYSYFMKLKRQIERVWTYPRDARMRGEQGELLLVFTISSDGKLERVTILDSSLHASLDNEAIRAINTAAPYNPFPKSWELERLNVRAIFSYRLGFWSFRR